MLTTSATALKNPGVEAKTPQLVSRMPQGYTVANQNFNRKAIPYMHGALTPPREIIAGNNANVGAARGVLPCQAAYNAGPRVLRVPPQSSASSMVCPVGAFRNQKLGIYSQFPVLKSLPPPVSNYR